MSFLSRFFDLFAFRHILKYSLKSLFALDEIPLYPLLVGMGKLCLRYLTLLIGIGLFVSSAFAALDLQVSRSASKAYLHTGDTVTYTLTISNA